MVFAVNRVNLHRLARLVIGSEVIAVSLLNIYARLMGELVRAAFDQSQGRLASDYIFESRVVDDESRAFGGESREVLLVGRGGFPVEFGDCFEGLRSRHLWSKWLAGS